MAAPTPVSSLVHSSTLVTAGVFILIRFNKILIRGSLFLLIIRLITLLIAGIIANYEWDIKKLIALSTLSQLGFICVSLSLGMVILRFFHLLTHALFKASLFIRSGVVIHTLDSSQEFRNSSLISVDYLLGRAVLVCVFCLIGFPFFSGFFSKDFILDGGVLRFFLYIFFLCGVLTTVGYSLRFV